MNPGLICTYREGYVWTWQSSDHRHQPGSHRKAEGFRGETEIDGIFLFIEILVFLLIYSMMHTAQYPVLSDVKKEVFKVYGIGKGMLGLAAVARVTFIVDKKGIVR